MPPTPDERTARIQLALLITPGDPVTAALVAHLGATETLRLVREPNATAPTGLEPRTLTFWRHRLGDALATHPVTAALAACERHQVTITVPGEGHWPTGLDDLGDGAPLALFAQGDLALLAAPLAAKIAVIGSRAATAYGVQVATQATEPLAASGRVIVSGGAYGIDAAAHRAALAAGGRTVAVLANGLDRLYPVGNADLLAEIALNGALVSEAAPGVPPSRARFLQRNRIVAATCGLTLVVEAAWRSGSLDTVHRAHRLGRTVAAVPGPVTSAASAGTNRLIGDGTAHLVADEHDIRLLLQPVEDTTPAPTGPQPPISSRRAALHDFTIPARPSTSAPRLPGPSC